MQYLTFFLFTLLNAVSKEGMRAKLKRVGGKETVLAFNL